MEPLNVAGMETAFLTNGVRGDNTGGMADGITSSNPRSGEGHDQDQGRFVLGDLWCVRLPGSTAAKPLVLAHA